MGELISHTQPDIAVTLPEIKKDAPICFIDHNFAQELQLFDQKRPLLTDPEYAIKVAGRIRHAFPLTHRRHGQTIYGVEVTPEFLSNASRTQFEIRGLREVLILVFGSSPRKALEFAYPEVAEQARLEANLAVVETLPQEQRGPRLISTDIDQIPKPFPATIEDTRLLIQAAKGGDADAFGHLYNTFSDRIYRHIYYRVRSTQDAEDLLSQVFLNAWRAMPRYKNMGRPFQVWLLSIAHNLVVDYYKAQKPQTSLEDVVIPSSDIEDPVLAAERNIASLEVRQAILKLKKDQQQVVILRFIDGLEYPDIAAIMGKREGATRVILQRGLQSLRKMLKDGDIAAEYLGAS